MRRSWLFMLVGIVALGVFAAAPVRVAAEAPADEHAPAGNANPAAGHGDAAHGGDKSDIFGKALDLGIWTVVVFLLLFLVLRKFAWAPLLEGLQTRERNIHEALEQAQRAQREAQALREQHQRAMEKVQDDIRNMLDQARAATQRTADEMLTKARGEIQSERERLRREIDIARDQALQQIWSHAAELATAASAKAIRRELNPNDYRRLVDDALVELREAVGNGQGRA